jgi:hypothetical protein
MATRRQRCPSSMTDFDGTTIACVIANRPSERHQTHVGLDRTRTHIFTWLEDSWMRATSINIDNFHNVRPFPPVPPRVPAQIWVLVCIVQIVVVTSSTIDLMRADHMASSAAMYTLPILADLWAVFYLLRLRWTTRRERQLRQYAHEHLNGSQEPEDRK